MKWPWTIEVRTRDASPTSPPAAESNAQASELIIPSENERPTRKFAVPPTLRDESTVHRAPTREFPAHVDPSEAFAAVDTERDSAAGLDQDGLRTTDTLSRGARRAK